MYYLYKNIQIIAIENKMQRLDIVREKYLDVRKLEKDTNFSWDMFWS